MATKPDSRLATDFAGIASIACADDGRLVAGEKGGYGLICWDATGAVAWRVVLAEAPQSSRYSHKVCVRVRDDAVIVAATDSDQFRVLDLATGAERSRHDGAAGVRTMEVTKDRTRLVVRASIMTEVRDARSFELVAQVKEAGATSRVLALSADGRWAAVCGRFLHLVDLEKLVVVRSVSVPDEHCPWAGTFTNDAVVIGRTTLRAYALPDLTLKKEIGSSRSPVNTAAATSPNGARMAIVTDRGSVTIYDASTFEPKQQIKGHDPSVPDTFAKDVAALVFTPNDDLVVSAPLKKQLMGVTVHRLGA